MVPAMTSAIGGQPGTLMIGLPEMQLVHRRRAGRVRPGRLDAAVRSAAAPGDDGLRAGRRLLDDVERRPARDAAVDAAVLRRHRALDQHEVLALVLRHRVVQRLLGLLARGGLQRLGVVERDLVQHDVGDDGVRGADERLAAAGALLEVEPDDGQPRLGVEGLDHLGDGRRLDARGGGQPAAELEEVTPGVSLHPGRAPRCSTAPCSWCPPWRSGPDPARSSSSTARRRPARTRTAGSGRTRDGAVDDDVVAEVNVSTPSGCDVDHGGPSSGRRSPAARRGLLEDLDDLAVDARTPTRAGSGCHRVLFVRLGIASVAHPQPSRRAAEQPRAHASASSGGACRSLDRTARTLERRESAPPARSRESAGPREWSGPHGIARRQRGAGQSARRRRGRASSACPEGSRG